MEPWYVRLNPEGTHIPVLVHGETILNDPETIIDYIDTLSNGKVDFRNSLFISYLHLLFFSVINSLTAIL